MLLKDRPDDRDLKFKTSDEETIPIGFIRAETMPKRRQIGGSCQSNAVCNAIELQTGVSLSAEYVYHFARFVHFGQIVTRDSGAGIRSAIKAINRFGAPPRSFVCQPDQKPEVLSISTATYKMLVDYSRVDSLNDMKRALSQRKLIVAGFSVYDAFPNDFGDWIGEHALCIVGYDPHGFFALNSWGCNSLVHLSNKYVDTSYDRWVI